MSKSNKNVYRLINPYIEGSIPTIVKAKNSFDGGKKIYSSLSKLFTNTVDNFYMTIENTKSKKLTHFKIKEKRGENNIVNFKLSEFTDNFDTQLENKLIKNIKALKQEGGKKRKFKYDISPSSSSSSSSSDSDNDFDQYTTQPITNFIYYYLPYYKLNFIGITPIDTMRFFLPMFNLPINPSVQICFDLYKI